MYYVYILKCSDDSFYIGLTTDMKKRIEEHQACSGAKYTRVRLPVTLEYSEIFQIRKDAEAREQQLKRWSKTKKKALIAGNINQLINSSKKGMVS